MIREPHVLTTCPICAALSEGRTHRKNGEPFPALCAVCGYHHYDSYPHAEPTDKRTCPRCREARRALVDILSGYAGRKTYGKFCAACYQAEGYEMRVDSITGAVSYLKPTPQSTDEEIDAFLESQLKPAVGLYTRGKRGLRL